MFQRTLILSSLALLTAIVSAIWQSALPCSLEKEITSSRPSLAQQIRRGVRKDIWIPKEESRTHLTIQSEDSELTLRARSGKIETTEQLHQIEATGKEEKGTFHFVAQDGIYFYPSHHFSAQEAEFESDALRGWGKQVIYNGDTLEIHPSCNLHFSSGNLHCKGPLTIHPEEQFAETQHPFHYEASQLQIKAASGRLLYADGEEKNFQPQTIECEGAVRLVLQENYALADQLVYFPETERLHLVAKSPSRVLFWKSDGSIQISAPEVEAQGIEVKGIGDVHCAFDLEERLRIETLFGHYLR